jgi:UDP-N-acetylglucosamine diphosphorylase / glucose-1-phosphate thymidylyltransferase / UDP-N-acetylgalactosamine diphosphorylase / glucosamine-1-phosphate N-acetyltransferase / galactosamine-1-phosphate N-acetyltransferase
MKASDFFTLPASLEPFKSFFLPEAAPWEWLPQIRPALAGWQFESRPLLSKPAGVHMEGLIYLHPTVKLPPYAVIIGPAWIGPDTEIRAGAIIRGNVIVGAGCVLGNACEFKNSLLLDGVQTPHYNYVGDSILGTGVHLGAGAICSNLRLDKKNVVVRTDDSAIDTGLRKLGGIVGDRAEIGCNAVLNPGALLGPRSLVMPTVAFTGYLPPAMIAKSRSTVSLVERR